MLNCLPQERGGRDRVIIIGEEIIGKKPDRNADAECCWNPPSFCRLSQTSARGPTVPLTDTSGLYLTEIECLTTDAVTDNTDDGFSSKAILP